MRITSRVLLISLAAAFVTNAAAGVFDEDARREVKDLRSEMNVQLRDIDTRIARVDDSIKNLGIIQLLNQIEQLNAELAKLRGQNEVLANQNEQLTKRQKDFYLDIDTRLRKLEGLSERPQVNPPPVKPMCCPGRGFVKEVKIRSQLSPKHSPLASWYTHDAQGRTIITIPTDHLDAKGDAMGRTSPMSFALLPWPIGQTCAKCSSAPMS